MSHEAESKQRNTSAFPRIVDSVELSRSICR